MPWAIPAAIAGSSIVSGVMGNKAAAADREAAAAARQAAVEQFLSVNVPDPTEQKVQLERFRLTGTLSPELEQTFQQQQTELGGIVLDPTSKMAEMEALRKMQEVAKSGGLDAQAQEKLQTAINAANAAEKGQRDAIVQRYAAMGKGGSGAQLQAELLAEQAGANRASQQGLQAAADAEQRALAAMTNSFQMGSGIRQQDYSQAAEAAKAQDLINQFNARNSQAVTGANIDRQNDAAKFNLNNAQSVSNLNTGVANQEETHNKGLVQQQFQNEMQRAAGASGQYAGVAQQANADADRTAGMWSGIGQAIGQGASAYGQYKNNQDQLDAYNKRTDLMASGKIPVSQ